jgi:hypothetical protein
VLYEYTHPEQHFCEQTNLKRINSTDPGHLTVSGFVSHAVAVSLLVGSGLFASVLAPPAATSIIKDLSIKAGSKAYQGPAQKLWNQVFASSGSGGSSSSISAVATSSTVAHSKLPPTSILARNYHNSKPPAMSRLNSTTRMATSVHKY